MQLPLCYINGWIRSGDTGKSETWEMTSPGIAKERLIKGIITMIYALDVPMNATAIWSEWLSNPLRSPARTASGDTLSGLGGRYRKIKSLANS